VNGDQISRKWAVIRIILGQVQMVGATIGVYFLLTTGVSEWTIGVVTATVIVTLASKLLFQSPERAMFDPSIKKHVSEFLGTFGLVFGFTLLLRCSAGARQCWPAAACARKAVAQKYNRKQHHEKAKCPVYLRSQQCPQPDGRGVPQPDLR